MCGLYRVIAVSGNLTLLDSDRSDLGEYKCVASNGISSVTATAQLYISLPPDTGSLRLSTCHNQSRFFSCEVH